MSAVPKPTVWTIVRAEDGNDDTAPLYRCLHDDQGRYVADVHALVTETTEHLDDRARRIVAALNAVAGIPTEDLERLAVFCPYMKLIKLSFLADRQAMTHEGHPDREYVTAAPAVAAVAS